MLRDLLSALGEGLTFECTQDRATRCQDALSTKVVVRLRRGPSMQSFRRWLWRILMACVAPFTTHALGEVR